MLGSTVPIIASIAPSAATFPSGRRSSLQICESSLLITNQSRAFALFVNVWHFGSPFAVQARRLRFLMLFQALLELFDLYGAHDALCPLYVRSTSALCPLYGCSIIALSPLYVRLYAAARVSYLRDCNE